MKSAIIDRIFLLLFTVVCLFTGFWIFHTHTVLQNTGSPPSVIRLFNINTDLLYNIVTIFSLILLALSNIFYWRTGNGIFFLWSVLYFTAGIISLSILEDARFSYTKQYGLWKGGFSSGFVATAYLILSVIIVTLIDFFIIKYLRKRFLIKHRNL
jgi:4-hydroxybenzoate polyprenyltransferase